MAVVKIAAFGGMIPAVDNRLLPDTAAVLSRNCYLYTGQLVGMVSPKFIRSMTNVDYGKAYRIPKNYYDAEHIEDSVWMEFPHIDTDILRSPIVGDEHDRYYWASPLGPPKVNSFARIEAGSPPYTLGVIQPAAAPTITSIVGGVGANETRSYVVTYVTDFAEEGPPSLPVLSTGKNDATWNLGLPSATSGEITTYNLTKKRIYRTTGTGGSSSFFFVTELPMATTTFADNIPNTTVSSNELLASTEWIGPPADLVGFVTMPNGMIAGWKGSELWFCEPFRPHAWPAAYSSVVEYPIIGLGVINQTLVICTAGYPIVATGIHPDAISMSKLASFEPCMSRGSILSVPEGVFYASPNGLVLVANGVAKLVTEGLIQKDEWNHYNKVATMRATRLGSAYYSFGSERVGFTQPDSFQQTYVQTDDFAGSYKGILMDNANQRIAFNTLTSEIITTNVFNDAWSGETLIIRNDAIYRIDLADLTSARDRIVWQSKIFQAPDKKNFASMRVYFETPPWASAIPVTKIPVMTSNVTSGVTMFSDSVYLAGYEAWRAADADLGTYWHSGLIGFPHDIKVDFGAGGAFTADRYSFRPVGNWPPRDWTFQGSNDDIEWTVLDTQTDFIAWPAAPAVVSFDVVLENAYRYFRIVVTKNLQNDGTNNWATIGDLSIFPTAYGVVRVYADDRRVSTRELRTSSELMRLPSGFKADYWQIEFETTVKVNSVQMATSSKELLKG